jgi:glycosyltransferase involved in cell wall biosynthesis
MAARSLRALLDLLVLTAAYWLAYLLRFDWDVPHPMWKRLILTWPYVVGVQYFLLVLCGVPRFAWRHVGLREAIRIGFAAALAAAILLGARFLSPVVIPVFGYALYAFIPIGIILIDETAAFLGITGVRVLSRIFAERAQARQRRREGQPRRIPTLLVGAGNAGLLVAKEIASRPDLGIEPVGFLDDDRFKVGTVVHGIRVLGSTAELPRLCERTRAEQVVITIASARGADIRRIRQLCDRVGLPTKIEPGIHEIMSGQVNLSRIRPVAIEDLLRREPVKLDEETISAAVQGRTILVTGGGASIGSELCRQVSRFQPAQLVLVEQAENGLFHLERDHRVRRSGRGRRSQGRSHSELRGKCRPVPQGPRSAWTSRSPSGRMAMTQLSYAISTGGSLARVSYELVAIYRGPRRSHSALCRAAAEPRNEGLDKSAALGCHPSARVPVQWPRALARVADLPSSTSRPSTQTQVVSRPLVVHLTTVPESLFFLTGFPRFLHSRGFDVHVVSSQGERLGAFARQEGVTAHALDMPRRITPGRDIAATLGLFRLLRRLRPALVHAHTPKAGLLGMIAGSLAGVPARIYHIHGLPFVTATGGRRLLLRMTERISCSLASRVLCVSKSVRQMAIDERIVDAGSIEVPCNGSINGIDSNRFQPPTQSARLAARSRFGIPLNATVIGFVGRIVRDKGIADLVKAFSLLKKRTPDVRLLVVGAFEPQDPIPVDAERLLRTDPHIHLAGLVGDMPAAYASMDVLVLPSYREGLGLVTLEAAAMGLPAVATRIPGCIDAVVDGVTGTLVPARDVAALVDALTRYFSDPALRLAHGGAGRIRVIAEFRTESIWEATLQVYREILAGRPRAPRPSAHAREPEPKSPGCPDLAR